MAAKPETSKPSPSGGGFFSSEKSGGGLSSADGQSILQDLFFRSVFARFLEQKG